MKQVEHNGYLLQEVPGGAYGFEVYMVYLKKRLAWWENGLIGSSQEACDLPKANWQIISKASEITEEQAKGIVERDYFDGIGYQYANYNIERKWTFGLRKNTALESFHSLLKSKGMKPSETIILFNQQK